MISFQEKAYSDSEIYSELNPIVSKWFKNKFGSFSPPQTYAIMNIHKRENTLVSAPTGSGKTLSAFTSILNELITISEKKKLEDKIYCIYISPLKALSNDIHRNLEEPLREMQEREGRDFGIRVSVRTGDTTTSERQKMARAPPHILITTPESLAIILASPKFKESVKDVKWVITDEIHSLAENKRGTHHALTIERLQNHAGEFTRIGLSATVSPLEKIAEFLVGYDTDGKPRDCKVVDVQFIKNLDLKVLSPVPDIMRSDYETIQNETYKLIDQLIQAHNTTLVFTNTRSATERVVHHLKDKFPKNYIEQGDNNTGYTIGAHHSSLSREHRLDLEKRLKEGKLKAVVCSTSLELGIDIGDIDLVILLGSPRSIARALQRVGRSGHQLRSTIKGRFIVLNRDDLVECSVILKNAMDHHIDEIHIPENALDVLAQQIYGTAIQESTHIDTIYSTVKRAYPYRNLDKQEFNNVIKYLQGNYHGLEHRHVYGKIWYDEETGLVGKRGKLARLIYMTNIGTIPDESLITVKIGDQAIGAVDEEFLKRLKSGDIFVIGGNTYKYKFARGMTMQVEAAPGKRPTVPSWFSEMLPLSFELGMSIQRLRRLLEEKFKAGQSKTSVINWLKEFLYADDKAANSIYEYFLEQYKYSIIPHDKRIVIEETRIDDRKRSEEHTTYGRRTNDALSRAVAFMIGKLKIINVGINLSDNGFVLEYKGQASWVKEALESFRDPDSLEKFLLAAVDKTEVLKRRFRHCAGRALMILRTYKGQRKTAGRQQVSAQILLNAAKQIGPDFPVLKEARREVMEDLMDVEHAKLILNEINKGSIKIKETQTVLPSPFALNMVMQGYSDILKMEEKVEFLRRMHEQVLVKIALKEKRG